MLVLSCGARVTMAGWLDYKRAKGPPSVPRRPEGKDARHAAPSPTHPRGAPCAGLILPGRTGPGGKGDHPPPPTPCPCRVPIDWRTVYQVDRTPSWTSISQNNTMLTGKYTFLQVEFWQISLRSLQGPVRVCLQCSVARHVFVYRHWALRRLDFSSDPNICAHSIRNSFP